ncbi:PRC-barrel domain-containing protein [Micromonospora sp. RTGN7]|uniref:PRC-barrel domain-containing protein n=1 Tax=Micromonospora sp. RTGN7 TaxID=3016526 RepID=UPI0029FED65D|nr:PRC-barrel domain-containing protein [Micromonospora sp. RTGN7]
MRMQLGRQLLDRQIVDRDGRLVGKVDDVEFGVDTDRVPYVTALLTGQGALGQRIGGRVGRLLVAVADRFVDDPSAAPLRIPYPMVERVDSAVRLRTRLDELPGSPTEAWVRRHLIDRIPGSNRASG